MNADRNTRAFRGASALLIAAALLLGHPGTVVHAQGGAGVAFADSGTFTTQAVDGGHLLTVTAAFNGVVSGATLVETFTCTATAGPDAAGTSVSACAVNGVAAPAATLPGAAATTAGSVTLPLSGLAGVTMCATGQASFAESLTGASSLAASRCQSSAESVSTDGTFVGVTGNDQALHVTYSCMASATGGLAVSTTSTCTLQQHDGHAVAGSAQQSPGELAFSGGDTDVPVQSYTICAGGSATFLDGVTGQAAPNCS